jgi:hypothetical protein
MGPTKKSPKRGSTSKGKGKSAAGSSGSGTRGRAPSSLSASAGEEPSFPQAFAKLLRNRGLSVPKGLKDAPSEAYAGQPADFVEQLSGLSDNELKRYAEQVGGYLRRQEQRAKREWDTSPLIAELRKRKLKEPPPPTRAVGVSVSLAKPLSDWSNAEILRAADDWSRMGR